MTATEPVWKDKIDKIEKLASSIEKCTLEKNGLIKEDKELMRESYASLCQYLKLNLDADEDPMEKIEAEKASLSDKIENIKDELKKLDESKEDWKAKVYSKKCELRKIEEMRDDPNLGTDVQSKNKFKVLSKFLNVSYKTDQDSQATAAFFKDVNRQIRFDDHSKSRQQKMSEFWKIIEYIDRKESSSS